MQTKNQDHNKNALLKAAPATARTKPGFPAGQKHTATGPRPSIVGFCPLILLAALFLSSCEKFVDISPPATQLPAEKVYQSEATATAVLSYLYSSTSPLAGGGSYSMSFIGSLLADETELYSTTLSLTQLSSAQLVPTNDYASSHWQGCYSAIYIANALLEGVNTNPGLSEATTRQLSGEALFIRSLQHLYLAEIYGNVPLVTTTSYQLNTSLAQSSEKQVLARVCSDLELAAEMLPADYARYGNERIRATRFAAKALLARAYLYAGEYQKAELAASEVIANTALFGLGTLSETFLKNSKETILSYKPINGFNAGEPGLFLLTAKPTVLSLRASFFNSFELGDQRRAAWTGKLTASGTDYNFPIKYKTKTATAYTEYSAMLRLGETYLIRSEALARQDKLQAAIADLDQLRSRAGLSRIAVANPTISKTALLSAILQERKAELFTEWAHRWIDLRRFSLIDQVLSPIKTAWQPTAAYWPIPQSELRINKNLVQNPGY